MRAFPFVIALLVISAVKTLGHAQEVLLVYPPEFADAEGDGVSGTSSLAGHFQAVYRADEFLANLPPSHRWITGVRYRPDESLRSPHSTQWNDYEARLSTTAAGPGAGGLSLTFADNVGPDETVVYAGALRQETQNTGPEGGPKDFDIVLDFQTPFYYDPTQGNLLMDQIWREPFQLIPLDACCESPNPSTEWILRNDGNFAAELATIRGSGGGIQFVFVPEPACSTLALIALSMIAIRFRSLRR